MKKPANLPLSRGITQKQAAQIMGVSVRMVRDARRLTDSGRDDLIEQIMAGKLTLHKAMLLAGLKAKNEEPALNKAWRLASESERWAFLASIGIAS